MKKSKAYHEKKHAARSQRKRDARADKRRQAAAGKRTATKQERRANSIRQPAGKVAVFQSNRHARVMAQLADMGERLRGVENDLKARVSLLMTDAIEEGDKAA